MLNPENVRFLWGNSNYFHMEVPVSRKTMSGDVLIAFTSDNLNYPFLREIGYAQVEMLIDGNLKIACSYQDIYDGNNFMSYVSLDQVGNVKGSYGQYINYNNQGNNSPNPDDPSRTLPAPTLLDQFGHPIAANRAVNINSIGNYGLDVLIPVGTGPGEKTINVGDVITLTVYLSHVIDRTSGGRKKVFTLFDNYKVQNRDVTNGYLKTTIQPRYILGFGRDDKPTGTISIDYRRLAPNTKSIVLVRDFDTYGPGIEESV